MRTYCVTMEIQQANYHFLELPNVLNTGFQRKTNGSEKRGKHVARHTEVFKWRVLLVELGVGSRQWWVVPSVAPCVWS